MASWLPDTTDLILEHHFGTDAATSLFNHATGTTIASITLGSGVPTPSFGTGFMDISGNATTGVGVDLGVGLSADNGHIIAVFDPNTGVGLVSQAGTNEVLKATGRVWFDANPANNETLTINGQAITFKTSGAVGFEVNIGATVQATAFETAALITANPGTFAVSTFCPVGNSVMDLYALTGGTAGNSIGVTTTASNLRIRAVGNPTTPVTALSTGTAGESVATGIIHRSTNIESRNSNIGVGGLAAIAVPGADYHYFSAPFRVGDFPKIRYYAGGALSSRANGTTAGRRRPTGANLHVALAGAGTGSAKIAFCAAFQGRALTEAQDLAAYLAVKAQLTSLGLTVA